MPAPTLVAGIHATGDWESTREDIKYMQEIANLKPWRHPALLFMMAIAHHDSPTVEFNHYEDQIVPYQDQINNSGGYGIGDVTFVVDNAKKFVAGDIVRNERTYEHYLVWLCDYTLNKITVIRDIGATLGSATARVAALLDNDWLTRIGNAYEQGHPFPDVRATKLSRVTNFCQLFRKGMAMTEEAIGSAVRARPREWTRQRQNCATEHMIEVELDTFFGQPYSGDAGLYDDATGNKAPAMCGGLDHFLVENANTDLLVDQDSLTLNEYRELILEPGFNKGSPEKYQYSPSKFFTFLDRIGFTSWNSVSQEKVFGFQVVKWVVSPNKVVYFIEHDGLTRAASTYYNYNFLVDHENCGWVSFNGTDEGGGQSVVLNGNTHWGPVLDYKNLDGKPIKKQEIITRGAPMIQLADTHARFRFKDFS